MPRPAKVLRNKAYVALSLCGVVQRDIARLFKPRKTSLEGFRANVKHCLERDILKYKNEIIASFKENTKT